MDINPSIEEWTLIASTLKWAGRLTPTERRWLDIRKSEKNVGKLLSQVNQKSPIRIILSMALSYSEESLEKQKHKVGELNKFHRLLVDINKKLYDLDSLGQQGKGANTKKIRSLKERRDKFVT